MGRPCLALTVLVMLGLWTTELRAAPRRHPEQRARVEGVQDSALRVQIERALGVDKDAPANRIEARRRARQAADSATALLRSEGYYDFTVTPDIGQGERPTPVVHIDPGVRTRLADPQISWIQAEPDPATRKAAVAVIGLKAGAPARAADVIAAQGRILLALQQAGYADAQPAPSPPVVDHADHTMHAVFAMEAGALVHLDGVVLHSKSRADARWITSLAPWKPGQVYKPNDIAELERRLIDTGVFDSVTVALAPAAQAQAQRQTQTQAQAQDLRPVVVSVADRAKHTLLFGAGYSTTEGPDLDTTWSTYNVLRRADTLTLLARAQLIDSRIGATLRLPDFLRPNQALRFGPDVFRDVTNAYTTSGVEFVTDLTQRYGKSSFFTRGLSLVASRIVDKELGSLDIFAVRPLVDYSLDRTDNPLDSHRGWKLDVRAEPIGIFGAETLFYFKTQSQASAYFPLSIDRSTVLAVRIHAGSIIGGKIPQVPASDRFFAGGGGSVRGYVYQYVGPHYADNTPEGGLSLVEGSVELRRTLFGAFGGVLFFDTGAVGSQSTPNITRPASSIGVGARYNLGFAPLRADFAFPITRLDGVRQAPIQVYLSIGQSF